MDKVSVSIIVPCYNVGDYVKRCLESLYNQTLENIEIIIVNDGSTDNTPKIIEDFLQTHHKDNVVFLNKENGGYGSAVNLGIEHSRGKYFAICESDDYVSEDFYETLYIVAEEKQADVAVYNAYIENREYFNHLVCDSYTPKKLNVMLSKEDLEDKILSASTAIWLAIYKKSFIQEKHIDLPETCKVYQDVPFVAKVFSTSEKIAYVIGARYYYTRGRAEQSVANPSYFIEIISAVKDALAYIDKQKLLINPEFIVGYLITHLLGRYNISLACKAFKTAEEIFNFLNNLLKERKCILKPDIIKELNVHNFYTDNIVTMEGSKQIRTFWNIPSVHIFSLNASYTEIFSYIAYKLLKAQNLNFNQDIFESMEFELSYLLNLPGKKSNSQITEVLLNFLKSYSANELIEYPRFLSIICVILKDYFKDKQLTLPVVELKPLGQDILDYFYDESAFKSETYASKMSAKLQSFMKKSEEKFLKFIENKSIMVVGNSPIELGKNKGELIDSFDIVIRFNNFELKDFKKDYGSKTNIWAISPALHTIKQKQFFDFDFIISNDSTDYLIPFRRSLILNMALNHTAFFRIATYEFMKETQMRTLSLGLTMLLYLIKHKDKIKSLNICGFALDDQKDGINHYFQGDPSRGKILPFHNWDKEKKILNELIKSQRVKLC